jgi:NADPH-dependent 2,4-dienoyl-CoA reductase/sulfur reductase-like enzyme
MRPLETTIVVGASLAGLRAAETLRSRGYDGKLTLVGAEPHRPYDRPPLSKEILRGDWDPERTALTKPEKFDDLELDLHLGRRAVALDPHARQVSLDTGERLPYDGLIIATGARARTLRGLPDLPGIHVLRTLENAVAIRRELESSPRVVVVGAGFIGSEVAASCRARGLEVTVVEALAVPLAFALGTEMGEVVGALHRERGVRLLCGIGVEAIEGAGRVERVRLSDGRTVEADLVIIGIGVVPDTEWLESSGLALDDGVVCDSTLATSAPGVVAAGDVARWRNPGTDEWLRVEHWTNAVEQGVAAATRLLDGDGAAKSYESVPFVWSDQYDVKIQLVGLPRADDEVRLAVGSLDERRFVALYGRCGRLVGALGFNRPRPLMACRRLLREGLSLDDAAARLADAS